MLKATLSADTSATCTETTSSAQKKTTERPRVEGKFLFVGEEKFWVRGVTYGTFCPDKSGANYPPRDVVENAAVVVAIQG